MNEATRYIVIQHQIRIIIKFKAHSIVLGTKVVKSKLLMNKATMSLTFIPDDMVLMLYSVNIGTERFKQRFRQITVKYTLITP